MAQSRRRFLHSLWAGAAGLGAVAVLAACGDDATPAAVAEPAARKTIVAEPAQTSAAAASADATMDAGMVMSNVQFGADAFVRITNMGAAAQDLSGWQLCVRPAYWEFPARTLAPGQSLEVSFGRGDDTDTRVFTGGRVGPPNAKQGNLALYRGSAFSDPEQIVHFVQWGAAGLGRASVAVAAKIWTAGEFVEAGMLANGGQLEYTGSEMSAAGWTAHAG